MGRPSGYLATSCPHSKPSPLLRIAPSIPCRKNAKTTTTHTHTLTHTHTHTLTHTHTNTHTLTHTLTHSLTLSLTHYETPRYVVDDRRDQDAPRLIWNSFTLSILAHTLIFDRDLSSNAALRSGVCHAAISKSPCLAYLNALAPESQLPSMSITPSNRNTSTSTSTSTGTASPCHLSAAQVET